jgi:hypothetical protein
MTRPEKFGLCGPLCVLRVSAVKEAYQAEIRSFLHELQSNARARKMHYQLATTNAPYHQALEAYLTARTRL